MPATIVPGDLARRHGDRQVVLDCGDPQWVRAQFEAIVAAEWPQQPPRVRVGIAEAPRAGRIPTAGAGVRTRLPHRVRAPGTDGWARQRSPPA